ncbi:hypothetical protein LTR39_006217 [Cryomyces antarcticus]|nr:hypothetical protein LTR39_006217 [Cryomyces antarcticus]
MILGTEGTHPHAMTKADFDALFTEDRAIHFNYHGYAHELKGLLFGRSNIDRATVECYREEGSTTTPFDMMLMNHVSRYHVAEYAIQGGARVNEKVKMDMGKSLAEVGHMVKKCREYILANGKDPDDTYDTPKFEAPK